LRHSGRGTGNDAGQKNGCDYPHALAPQFAFNLATAVADAVDGAFHCLLTCRFSLPRTGPHVSGRPQRERDPAFDRVYPACAFLTYWLSSSNYEARTGTPSSDRLGLPPLCAVRTALAASFASDLSELATLLMVDFLAISLLPVLGTSIEQTSRDFASSRVYAADDDLRRQPLAERKAVLWKLLARTRGDIQYAAHWQMRGQALSRQL